MRFQKQLTTGHFKTLFQSKSALRSWRLSECWMVLKRALLYEIDRQRIFPEFPVSCFDCSDDWKRD